MSLNVEIPYGNYWSTPFCKWQGSFQHLHSLRFAAHVGKNELEQRGLGADLFDYGVLGITIPQQHTFYGLPWLTGIMGLPGVTGPTISQACATGARCLAAAAQEIETGAATTALVITCDKTSNGPHLYYPSFHTPGGTGAKEDWVMDNFNCDPLGKHAMIQTAENVAARFNISTGEQHDVVLQRYAQYQDAINDDHAFQKRYMTLPFEVPNAGFRKVTGSLDGDEGITPSTAAGMEKLQPVLENGTVTFAGQTHPADGNAGIIVTTPERAWELSKDPGITCRILGFGMARHELAYMPLATIPAARQALEQAGIDIKQIKAIKSHNPFALNDIIFARETGADLKTMNNYGSSLIWGHPQAPTGLRGVIELIEELAINGGGYGLFFGCAAGDSAMAVVLAVDEAK